MKQDMKKWVEELKNTKEKKGFLVLSFPAIQKMGITVKELVSSSDLQAEAMKIVADSTPEALASVSMMDLSLEAEAFGSSVRFADDEVPTIIGSIVNSEEEAEAFLEDCMAVVVDSLKEVREYFEENGMDVEDMSMEELEDASEVFPLPNGQYLIVEG